MLLSTCPRCAASFEVASVTGTLPTCPRCQSGEGVTLSGVSIGGAATPGALAFSHDFLGRYRIVRYLGEGAMGTVLQAVRNATGEDVAVKFLIVREREDALARFRREGALLAQLDHPNVVRLVEVGDEDAYPYLVTEFLPGGTLSSRLAEGPLTPDRALALLLPALEGLAYCHGRGIVHRDIKPDNILFTAAGQPRIADLGIARGADVTAALTRTGSLLGTPRYMSPEQVRGEAATPASDVYAMGVVLYQMLAGAPPFASPDPTEVLRMHLQREPPPLTAPPALAAAVMAALAKDATSRPRDARELARLLEAARRARARPLRLASGPPVPSGASLSSAAHARRVIACALALGLVALIVRLTRPAADAGAGAPAARSGPAGWYPLEGAVPPDAPGTAGPGVRAMEARLAELADADATRAEALELARLALLRASGELGERAAAALAPRTVALLAQDLSTRAENLKGKLDDRVNAFIDPDDGMRPRHPEADQARRAVELRALVRDYRVIAPVVMERYVDGLDEYAVWRTGELLVKGIFATVDGRLQQELCAQVARWAAAHPRSWLAHALEAQRLREGADLVAEKGERFTILALLGRRLRALPHDGRAAHCPHVTNFYTMAKFAAECAVKLGDPALGRQVLAEEDALVRSLDGERQLTVERRRIQDAVHALVERP